jgi:rhodanese-related sulfurtransferase
VLTGDTVFIGDVGRPDLGGDPKELAAMLYDSLHGKLMKLPDEVEVFPAHGAGSLCGRAMSTDRSSTIGRERQTNYALQAPDKTSFVELLTSELPDRPDYFATDVELNRKGATPLDQLQAPQALSPQEVRTRQAAGAIVLDTRDEDAYGAGHVPGSISISLDGQFAVWAGTIVGLEIDVIIVAEDEERVRESQMRLTRVGIDRATAYLAGGIAAWKAANMPLAQIPLLDPREFASAIEQPNVQVVDVRRPVEWSSGHLPSAVHMPLNRLIGTMRELDPKRPIAVHCKSGYRSSIAVSLLEREGFSNIVHMRGGWDAWQETGH